MVSYTSQPAHLIFCLVSFRLSLSYLFQIGVELRFVLVALKLTGRFFKAFTLVFSVIFFVILKKRAQLIAFAGLAYLYSVTVVGCAIFPSNFSKAPLNGGTLARSLFEPMQGALRRQASTQQGRMSAMLEP